MLILRKRGNTMKYLSDITDPVSASNVSKNAADAFFSKFIRDERDLPFIYLTLSISFTLIPLAVALYIPHLTMWLWWPAALLYIYLNNFILRALSALCCTAPATVLFLRRNMSF